MKPKGYTTASITRYLLVGCLPHFICYLHEIREGVNIIDPIGHIHSTRLECPLDFDWVTIGPSENEADGRQFFVMASLNALASLIMASFCIVI